MLFEFYQFKEYKKEKLIAGCDFEAIEEDLEFIIHKKVVSEEVNIILIVLSRILNTREDKKLRLTEKQMIQKLPKFFPIELEQENQANPNDPQIDSTADYDNPSYTSTQKLILKQLRESESQKPFSKAIKEVRKVFASQSLSPLDKLYKM